MPRILIITTEVECGYSSRQWHDFRGIQAKEHAIDGLTRLVQRYKRRYGNQHIIGFATIYYHNNTVEYFSTEEVLGNAND